MRVSGWLMGLRQASGLPHLPRYEVTSIYYTPHRHPLPLLFQFPPATPAPTCFFPFSLEGRERRRLADTRRSAYCFQINKRMFLSDIKAPSTEPFFKLYLSCPAPPCCSSSESERLSVPALRARRWPSLHAEASRCQSVRTASGRKVRRLFLFF